MRRSGRLCAECPWRFIVFSFLPAFVAMPPRGPEDLAEPGWLIRPFDREDVRELQILIGMCVFEQLPRANAQGERKFQPTKFLLANDVSMNHFKHICTRSSLLLGLRYPVS